MIDGQNIELINDLTASDKHRPGSCETAADALRKTTEFPTISLEARAYCNLARLRRARSSAG